LQRFAADPVRGTFTAFAKVSKLLTNTLVASEDKNSVPPEICDQLRISVEENETDFSAIHSTQPEDPDFLFIDEKVFFCLCFPNMCNARSNFIHCPQYTMD